MTVQKAAWQQLTKECYFKNSHFQMLLWSFTNGTSKDKFIVLIASHYKKLRDRERVFIDGSQLLITIS